MSPRKSAPPIPHDIALMPGWVRDESSDVVRDIKPHIEDWRLEIDFHRTIIASLWLEFKPGFDFFPLTQYIHLTGGDHTLVDITLAAVLPERIDGRWQITFYDVDGLERAQILGGSQ